MSLREIKVVLIESGGDIDEQLCDQIDAGGGEAFLVGRTASHIGILADKYGWGFSAVNPAEGEQLSLALANAEGVLGGANVAVVLTQVFLPEEPRIGGADSQKIVTNWLSTTLAVVRNCAPLFYSEGGLILLVCAGAVTKKPTESKAVASREAAIDGWIRTMSLKYASKAIRINAIVAEPIECSSGVGRWHLSHASEASLRTHFKQSRSELVDIAKVVCWLASPEANWMTGQTIKVAGCLPSEKILSESLGYPTP